MSYTKEEVIEELEKLYQGPKTRLQKIVEQRSYLIAVLYYKFKLTESSILKHTTLASLSSINHDKRLARELYIKQDPIFLKNTEDLIKKFPFEFSEKDILFNVTKYAKKYKYKLQVYLNEKEVDCLTKYMHKKKFANLDVTAQNLLKSILNLWVE